MKQPMEKIVIEGYAGACCNNQLLVNTPFGVQELYFKDHKQAWKFYCHDLKITIESIKDHSK